VKIHMDNRHLNIVLARTETAHSPGRILFVQAD